MQKMTIKTYAIKHKLSIFNVMKMVKSKNLKSEEIEENGKSTIYILFDEESEKEVIKGIQPFPKLEGDKMTIEKEVEMLKTEVQALRLELEILKRKI